MCGRYAFFTPRAQALAAMPGNPRDLFNEGDSPRYNVAPGTYVPAFRRADREAGITLEPLWWGYHPTWAPEDAPSPINAKAEKVGTSRYYLGAFRHHRCIICADGWFEWLKEAGGKQPHFITRRDRGLIWLAGIWMDRPDDKPGLAIITHDARGPAAEVHSRMPLALDDACLTDWLDPGLTDRDEIRHTIRPLTADLIEHYPVSRDVNRVGNDNPALVEPLPAEA